MKDIVKLIWILLLGIGGGNVFKGCYECCEDKVF